MRTATIRPVRFACEREARDGRGRCDDPMTPPFARRANRGDRPWCGRPRAEVLDDRRHPEHVPGEPVSERGDRSGRARRAQRPRKRPRAQGREEHVGEREDLDPGAWGDPRGEDRDRVQDPVELLREQRHSEGLVRIPERKP